jgi:glucokinase
MGEQMHSIGIDIGGTKMAGALVDDAGNILSELKVPSPIDDSDQMIEAIGSLISALEIGRAHV